MFFWLDCDGVLADFRSAAFAIHGKQDTRPDRYDIWNIMGLSQAKFWKPIDAAGQEFWATLPPYPWIDELCELIASFGGTIRVLTKPAPVAGCLDGKVAWLERQFGAPFLDYHMAPNKYQVSGRYRVLIDDNNVELGRWLLGGGYSIAFPQPWNAAYSHVSDRFDYLRDRMRHARTTFLQPLY